MGMAKGIDGGRAEAPYPIMAFDLVDEPSGNQPVQHAIKGDAVEGTVRGEFGLDFSMGQRTLDTEQRFQCPSARLCGALAQIGNGSFSASLCGFGHSDALVPDMQHSNTTGLANVAGVVPFCFFMISELFTELFMAG